MQFETISHDATAFFPSDPHAQTAVLLASFDTPDRAETQRVLRETGTPPRLYFLARLLRAAQRNDQREAEREAELVRMRIRKVHGYSRDRDPYPFHRMLETRAA